MAIYIGIDKINEFDQIHIYNVTTADRGGWNFYIVLSQKYKTISIFTDTSLAQRIALIDLNKPDEHINVPSIDPIILGNVIIQCIKAFRSNNFPQKMGYCA